MHTLSLTFFTVNEILIFAYSSNICFVFLTMKTLKICSQQLSNMLYGITTIVPIFTLCPQELFILLRCIFL